MSHENGKISISFSVNCTADWTISPWVLRILNLWNRLLWNSKRRLLWWLFLLPVHEHETRPVGIKIHVSSLNHRTTIRNKLLKQCVGSKMHIKVLQASIFNEAVRCGRGNPGCCCPVIVRLLVTHGLQAQDGHSDMQTHVGGGWQKKQATCMSGTGFGIPTITGQDQILAWLSPHPLQHHTPA